MNDKNGDDERSKRSNDWQQARSLPNATPQCGAALGENPDSHYRCRLHQGHDGDHLFQLDFTKPPA
jgi:hypothetical protein